MFEINYLNITDSIVHPINPLNISKTCRLFICNELFCTSVAVVSISRRIIYYGCTLCVLLCKKYPVKMQRNSETCRFNLTSMNAANWLYSMYTCACVQLKIFVMLLCKNKSRYLYQRIEYFFYFSFFFVSFAFVFVFAFNFAFIFVFIFVFSFVFVFACFFWCVELNETNIFYSKYKIASHKIIYKITWTIYKTTKWTYNLKQSLLKNVMIYLMQG